MGVGCHPWVMRRLLRSLKDHYLFLEIIIGIDKQQEINVLAWTEEITSASIKP